MNRLPSLLLVLVCLPLLFATSCTQKYKKPQDDPIAPVNPGGPAYFPVIPLNELFKDFRYGAETHCVIAGIGNTFTCAHGTKLIFYPYSFLEANGDTISGVEVCVSVTEIYKPGDMIQNRATTTTNEGDLLQCTGQVIVSATLGGQKVYAQRYRVAFKQPEPSVNRMDLYYGTPLNTDSLTKWAITDSVGPGTTSLATAADSTYIFDSVAHFTWAGSERLFDTATVRTDINIAIPNAGFDPKNTSVYVVFPSINGVVAATYARATGTFLIGGDLRHKVPTGMTVHVIVLSKSEGNYYYYEQKDLVVTSDMYLTAPLAKQTFDYIRTKLWAL